MNNKLLFKKITMKNIKILLALLLGIAILSSSAQVAVSTDGSSADASAMLDVKSTTKGVLITRMSQTQRNAISSPATGLMVYQTDNTPGFYYYNGSEWIPIGGDTDLSAYALKNNVLGLDNTTSFTPDADYEPATKEYVDNRATQWSTNSSQIYYNGGYLGIGTGAPKKRLHVYQGSSGQNDPNTTSQLVVEHSSYSGMSFLSPHGSYILFGDAESNQTGRIFYTHSSDILAFGTNGSSSDMQIYDDGDVGVNSNGYSSISKKFWVNGTAGGTTNWASTSDKRFKKDVKPISNGLDKVMKLQGVSFNWNIAIDKKMKFDDRNHIGFLAQDLEEVLPQVVFTADDEMKTKSVAYADVVPVLVEAIKEQQGQIEQQNGLIESQQKQLNILKQELADLIKSIGK